MSITLTDLCETLNNWFDTKSDGTKDRVFGTFTIENGTIDLSECEIKTGQYFRVIGSTFNDGVYQYPAEGLTDEVFDGAIWIMYVPKQVGDLLQEINDWNDKYGAVIDSPFASESFGGYTYYKSFRDTMPTVVTGWATQFSAKLNKYRKVRNI